MGEDAKPPKAKSVQKATEANSNANEAVVSIKNQVFQLYSNLLSEEARCPWNNVIEEQIDYKPWTDH